MKGSLARVAARQWAASRGVSVKVRGTRGACCCAASSPSTIVFVVGLCGRVEGLAGGRGKIGGERLCPLPFGLLLPLFAQPSFAVKSLVGSDVKGNHLTCKETMHESEVRSPLHPRAR